MNAPAATRSSCSRSRGCSPRGAPLVHTPVTGVPPAVGDVLARSLARLPRDVVDLLAIAAVVGKRFAVAAVAAIAGLPAEDAVPLVDIAARAGIVEHDPPGGAGSVTTCSVKSCTRGCPRPGGRRCTLPLPSGWRATPIPRPGRLRSPTTARWRCRWATGPAP